LRRAPCRRIYFDVPVTDDISGTQDSPAPNHESGAAVTRCLAEAGATVIALSRTPDKAKRALANIPRVEQGTLDLADPDSVDGFSKNFIASGRPLHLLINNAGVMATPLTRDTRGHEIQFATNHLGHFQLTSRLWPALEQANGARVVTLSYGGHRFSAFDFDDPDFERWDHDKWRAYGQSKTANVLFTVELDKRGKPHNIRAFAVHPGRITTDLQRFIAVSELQALGYLDEKGEIPLSTARFTGRSSKVRQLQSGALQARAQQHGRSLL
jgi:NAD(P)-dependent dehydrogenase (short-subunit alcohol dehydrogenase family)